MISRAFLCIGIAFFLFICMWTCCGMPHSQVLLQVFVGSACVMHQVLSLMRCLPCFDTERMCSSCRHSSTC
jgi:hypothetical protein